MSERLERLSRAIAYALRHQPEAFGLTLDKDGWVEIATLLPALAQYRVERQTLTSADVTRLYEVNAKPRFETSAGKIRALYGHTVKHDMNTPPKKPPEVLFHGTTRRALPQIQTSGLRPMQRRFVHLSPDEAGAAAVSRRRSKHPVIITVLSRKAATGGQAFYSIVPHVWLTGCISPKYLHFPNIPSAD